MFASLEKALISQNFYKLSISTNKNIIYANKHDPRSQVEISFDDFLYKWIFSFPLKNSKFNYKSYFNSYEEMKNYALQRILDMST